MSDKDNTPAEGGENGQPEPGSDEYNRMMAERHDQGTGQPEEPQDTGSDKNTEGDQGDDKSEGLPEGGFGKFYNSETGEYDWQSHAKELQFKLDQKGSKDADDGDKSDDDGEDTEDNKSDSEDEAVQNVVEKAGLSVENLRDQISSDGKIADESREALINQGIPEQLVDEYVDLAGYRMEHETQRAKEYAGGSDAWDELNAWATENLTEGEKEHHNKLLRGGESDWKAAIDVIRAKKENASPTNKEGKLRQGGTSGGGSVQGYKSRAEMTRDMQDPRYGTDSEFRRKVMQKVEVATFSSDNDSL